MIDISTLQLLNQSTKEARLAALSALMKTTRFIEADPRYINNHIHSNYSFSPYSPTAAAYSAKYYGLCTAGIMDHDSIGGAHEFIEAGVILGLPTTVGLECRVSMENTPLEKRRTNNPDQIGVSYMTMHAVPHERIDEVQAFFAPLREKRNLRNRKMVDRMNALLNIPELQLDFEADVLPHSLHCDGGSVTERHLMYALAIKMLACTNASGICALLARMGVNLDEKQARILASEESFYYIYDLLGILKSAFVPKIYIDAADECLPMRDMAEFANRVGAVFAYAYLGDVGESVTGDKKAQQFEDAYLDELFLILKESGIRAITYMPTRNTSAQLARIRALCKTHGFFQISGEDINSPKQDFVSKAMENPEFENLIDAAWALIRHERGERIPHFNV